MAHGHNGENQEKSSGVGLNMSKKDLICLGIASVIITIPILINQSPACAYGRRRTLPDVIRCHGNVELQAMVCLDDKTEFRIPFTDPAMNEIIGYPVDSHRELIWACLRP